MKPKILSNADDLKAMMNHRHNKSKHRVLCSVCNRGWLYQYKGKWSKCGVCGFRGYR